MEGLKSKLAGAYVGDVVKYRNAIQNTKNVYLLLKVTPSELNKSEGTLVDQLCLETGEYFYGDYYV